MAVRQDLAYCGTRRGERQRVNLRAFEYGSADGPEATLRPGTTAHAAGDCARRPPRFPDRRSPRHRRVYAPRVDKKPPRLHPNSM